MVGESYKDSKIQTKCINILRYNLWVKLCYINI